MVSDGISLSLIKDSNSLWNFCYAMTGAADFDLEESIWHLKEFPLDMILFESRSSHRKDSTFLEPNFWSKTTSEVLPPNERPELKHNRSFFNLDAGCRRWSKRIERRGYFLVTLLDGQVFRCD